MRISIFGGEQPSLDAAVDAAGQVEAEGFHGYHVPQIFGLDALTTLAVVGRQVPRIELGTGVVPTYPRHPMMLAAQALTTQMACDGRLLLGIGLSHQVVIESMFGLSFEKPARHMREYLSILDAAAPRRAGRVRRARRCRRTRRSTSRASTRRRSLVAALGPLMLKLAGHAWPTAPSPG